MTDVPSGEPSEDPRDALIREQAQLIAAQAEQIAALEATVAGLRKQLETAERAGSLVANVAQSFMSCLRNSKNVVRL